MKYVEQYSQWYCHTCQQYMMPQQNPSPAQPSGGGQNLSTASDLEYETVHSPAFTALIFYLKQGQSVVAEKGAMMYMHRTVEIQTHGRKGGLLKGVITSALGGESFFVNTFSATTGPGELSLVGPTMGDIRVIDVSKQGMILQSGAYLASAPQVNLDTKWQGLKGFLSERDFVMLHASGPGNVWVSSFGGIIEMNLQPNETVSVDTGHLVAFPDNMQFSVRRVGGWKSTILSGEGLVSDLVGPGKILMQTRHLPAFVQALVPFLPQQR
jgi:uncharacterized protein (TIGR00266 family)